MIGVGVGVSVIETGSDIWFSQTPNSETADTPSSFMFGDAKVKRKSLMLLAVAISVFMAPNRMLAHHGLAAYDMKKAVTVKGTVTEFSFINPHATIYLEAKGDKGDIEKWLVEADSPNNLARAGWNRNSIKRGDQIAVVGNRAKDGSMVLRLQKVIFSDGKELKPREGNEY